MKILNPGTFFQLQPENNNPVNKKKPFSDQNVPSRPVPSSNQRKPTMPTSSAHHKLAQALTQQYIRIPQVQAVALSGSLASHHHDPDSDIDLYVFTTAPIDLDTRRDIIDQRGATRLDLGLDFWDPGDQWFDAPTGIEVDIMFWDCTWVEDRLDAVLTHHQASLGYSTCTWHTIQKSSPLFDRSGWFKTLQETANQPYPLELQQAIIHKNYPVLRDVIPAYLHQIEKAIQRQDLVSLNHRLAAFLASYFDILFAINRLPHPGEKRLLTITPALCPILPPNTFSQIETILRLSAAPPEEQTALIPALHCLIDSLDPILP